MKNAKARRAKPRKAQRLSVSNRRDASGREVANDGTAFPIVGIGASAGGLDAFKKFFSALPGDSGLAFVLIQHLDPTRDSLTAELVGTYTRMRVVQVEDGMRVAGEPRLRHPAQQVSEDPRAYSAAQRAHRAAQLAHGRRLFSAFVGGGPA